jgi:hypothetical protein
VNSPACHFDNRPPLHWTLFEDEERITDDDFLNMVECVHAFIHVMRVDLLGVNEKGETLLGIALNTNFEVQGENPEQWWENHRVPALYFLKLLHLQGLQEKELYQEVMIQYRPEKRFHSDIKLAIRKGVFPRDIDDLVRHLNDNPFYA